MKQILFLLLLITSIAQGQTTLANKLKITGNATSSTATKVNVQEADGTVNTKPLSEFGTGTVSSVTGTNGVTVALGTTTPVIGLGDITPTSVTTNNVTYTPSTAPTYAEGKAFYDNTAKTLVVYDDISGTSTNLGQESNLRARNNTGSTILNGSVVYISGALGQNPTIALARANSLSTSVTIGIATHDILNNTVGKITTFGLVNDLNTSAFADGQVLYLSPTTAGVLTSTVPSSPNYTAYVCVVLHSHVTQGKIFVRPEQPISLNVALTDDNNTSPSVSAVKSYIDTGLASKAQLTGSENYIQNQNQSAQFANIWIAGSGTFNGDMNIKNTSSTTGKIYLDGTQGGARKYLIQNGITGFSNEGFEIRDITGSFTPFSISSQGIANFTNIPTVPTATVGTNTTQIASTAFVTQNTAIKSIDEGNGIGYVIASRNPLNYGNVGLRAIDFGYNESASTTVGAIGTESVVLSGSGNKASAGNTIVLGGYGNNASIYNSVILNGTGNNASGGSSLIGNGTFNTSSGSNSVILNGVNHTSSGLDSVILGGSANTTSGNYSVVMNGGSNTASANYSSVMNGTNNNASGLYSMVLGGQSGISSGQSSIVLNGLGNKSRSFGEITGGLFSTDYTPNSPTTFNALDRLYVLGNGTGSGATSNAIVILKNGLTTLPSVNNTLISAEPTGKAVVTKEYLISELSLKSNILSPTFTGVPTVPTATVGTNTTQIASTAFVQATTNSNAVLISGNQSFTGIKSATSTNEIVTQINLTNSNSSTGSAVANFINSATASDNSSSGAKFFNSNAGGATSAIQLVNETTGLGGFLKNLSTGTGLFFENWSTGVGFQFDSRTESTGDLIKFTKQGVQTGKINSDGQFTMPKLTMTGTIVLKSYTVATLPTGVQGASAYVTDALAPTYLVTIVGGGTVVTPVFYNGTNWVAH